MCLRRVWGVLFVLLGLAAVGRPVFAQFADVYWDAVPSPLVVSPGVETNMTFAFHNGGPDDFHPTAVIGRVRFDDMTIVEVEANPVPGLLCEIDSDQGGNFFFCVGTVPIVIPAGSVIAVEVTFIAPASERTIEAEAYPSSPLEPMENNVLDIPVTLVDEGATNLRTDIVANPNPVARGDVVRIEITITNEGPGDVAGFEQTTNVPLEFGLDLAHISTNPEAVCTLYPPINFRCDFGPLAAGAVAQLVLTLPIDDAMEEADYLIVSRARTQEADYPFTTVHVLVEGDYTPPQLELVIECTALAPGKRQNEHCAGRVDEDAVLTFRLVGDAVPNRELSLTLAPRLELHDLSEVIGAIEQTGQGSFYQSVPFQCGGDFELSCGGLVKEEGDLVVTTAFRSPLADVISLSAGVRDVVSNELLAETETFTVVFPRLEKEFLATGGSSPNGVIPIDVTNVGLVDVVRQGDYVITVELDAVAPTFLGASGDFEAVDQSGNEIETRLAGEMAPEDQKHLRLAFTDIPPTDLLDVSFTCEWVIPEESFEDPTCPELTSITISEGFLRVIKQADKESPPSLSSKVNNLLLPEAVKDAANLTYTVQIDSNNPGEAAHLEEYTDATMGLGTSTGCSSDAILSPTYLDEKLVECDVLLPAEVALIAVPGTPGLARNRVIARRADGTFDHAAVEVDVQGLSIVAETAVTEAKVGDVLGVELRITNEGSQDAPEVEGHLVLDNGWAAVLPVDEACDFSTDQYLTRAVCPLGGIAAGETKSTVIPIHVRGLLSDGRKIPRPVGLSASLTHGGDSDVPDIQFIPEEDAGQQVILDYDFGGGKRESVVDVYVDSTLVAAGVTSGTSTGYLDFPLESVFLLIQLREAGASDMDAPIASLTADLLGVAEDTLALSTRNVFLFADTPGDTLGLVVVKSARDLAEDPAMTDVLVVHAGADAPELLVQIEGVSTSEATLSFGEVSEYVALDPGRYMLSVKEAASGDPIDLIPFDISEQAGQAVTLVVSGRIGDDSFGLLAFDGSGMSVPTPLEEQVTVPERFVLHGNYPNPFNPTTTIRFDLPEPASVGIEVFDQLGRRVAELPAVSFGRGFSQTITFDASQLASGVYVYRLIADTERRTDIQTGQMVVVK